MCCEGSGRTFQETGVGIVFNVVNNRLRWGGCSNFGVSGRGEGDGLMGQIADGWTGKPVWGEGRNTWIKYVARP